MTTTPAGDGREVPYRLPVSSEESEEAGGDNYDFDASNAANSAKNSNNNNKSSCRDATDGYILIQLQQRSILTRLDVGPFIVLYGMLVAVDYCYFYHSSSSRHECTASAGPAYDPAASYVSTATDSALDDIVIPSSLSPSTWTTPAALFSLIAFPTVLSIHLTVFLLQQWSVSWRVKVGYHILGKNIIKSRHINSKRTTAADAADAPSHCWVIAPHVDQHHSSHDSGIVPIDFREQNVKSSNGVRAVINFQDIMFHAIRRERSQCDNDDDQNEDDSSSTSMDENAILWSTSSASSSPLLSSKKKNGNEGKCHVRQQQEGNQTERQSPTNSSLSSTSEAWTFHRLRYPVQFPLDFYQNWKGHTSIQQLALAKNMYGYNTTPIKLPPFVELLQEQVIAPFFLFQVLCVLLWCLDEYWYYAIFTFFALLMFESTMAYNRLKSLQRLRSYTVHEQRPIWVYRPSYPPIGKNDWIQISISELVPGDLVSCKQFTIGPSSSSSSSGVGRNNSKTHRLGDAKLAQMEQQLNRIPADILLLNGDAVVDESLLTGESVPQLKSSLEVNTVRSSTNLSSSCSSFSSPQNAQTKQLVHALDLQEHKQFILFGGTTMLVSHPGQSPLVGAIPESPPDDGAVGMVLRTGFETAQGSLLRTMAHTQKAVDGIHTRDTYLFILLLLLCAITSATAVWNHGWADEDRNKFRLILHVIMIVTSVVPPELPMELSLAVTNSFTDLIERKIFCTEVFRIPLAGQVDVCCFDKTGTLTSDQMQLIGVRIVDSNSTTADQSDNMTGDILLPDSRSLPWPSLRIMAGCHSLGLRGDVRNGYTVIGDPLEKTVLAQTGYQLVQNNALKRKDQTPSLEKPDAILILHRFAFSSRLKRMSVIARETAGLKIWVLSKGAPETLKMFFRPGSVPPDYDKICNYHMALGQRVLAMGYRELTSSEASSNPNDLKRHDIESNLLFAGFLLLQCPIKPDSSSVVTELFASGHHVVMITGDALLTAAEVARQVGIIRKSGKIYPPTFQLRSTRSAKEATSMLEVFSRFKLVSVAGTGRSNVENLSLSLERLEVIKQMVHSKQIALCISGDVLQQLVLQIVQLQLPGADASSLLTDEKQLLFHPLVQHVLKDIVPLVSVFARHAPRQKEAIVAAFNLSKMKTLMCGDGTNDVGALRRAHAGISIISAPEVEEKQRLASGTISRLKKERKKANSARSGSSSKFRNRSSDALALETSMKQLQEAQDELDQVELGDASIASPFTSRMISIRCCKDVLQQGRCTLITMLQIHKILGVNCLVNAMILSKLFLHGAKQGDRQLTILGFVVAALFFFVTRGKPLRVLSDVRPPTSVLSGHALVSIVAQFAIHYSAMVIATEVALSFVDPYDPSMIPDGPFNPNALNTCTFLVSATATVNTFAVNYAGEPFVERLSKNKMMFRSLQLSYGVLLISALEVFPPLNEFLQLDKLPDSSYGVGGGEDWMSAGTSSLLISGLIGAVEEVGFPFFLTGLMVADTALVFVAEKGIDKWFQTSWKQQRSPKELRKDKYAAVTK